MFVGPPVPGRPPPWRSRGGWGFVRILFHAPQAARGGHPGTGVPTRLSGRMRWPFGGCFYDGGWVCVRRAARPRAAADAASPRRMWYCANPTPVPCYGPGRAITDRPYRGFWYYVRRGDLWSPADAASPWRMGFCANSIPRAAPIRGVCICGPAGEGDFPWGQCHTLAYYTPRWGGCQPKTGEKCGRFPLFSPPGGSIPAYAKNIPYFFPFAPLTFPPQSDMMSDTY